MYVFGYHECIVKLSTATKNTDHLWSSPSLLNILFLTSLPHVFFFFFFFLTARLSILTSTRQLLISESTECVTLYCWGLTPNSQHSSSFFFAPTSSFAGSCGHSFLCGLRTKIDKEDPSDNLMLVKDAKDKIPSLAIHPQTCTETPHTHIYIHTHTHTHECPLLCHSHIYGFNKSFEKSLVFNWTVYQKRLLRNNCTKM